MRAMKKPVSLLLSLMMVLSIFTVLGITTASAAESNTITVTSNIGSGGDVQYTPGVSEQVTVTFNFQAAKKLVNVEGVMTYDTSVLKLADSNTERSVMPKFTANAMVNLTNPGRIKFVNSDIMNGYDFTTKDVFMTVVFDIIGSGNTTVNLDVMEAVAADTFPSQSMQTATTFISASEATGALAFTSENDNKVTPDSSIDFSALINDVRLDLQGRIGFKFYFLNSPVGYDVNKLSVSFDGPSESENALANGSSGKVALTSLKGTRYNGVPSRLQNYFVCAYMLTEPVKVTFYNDGEEIGTYSISAVQWVKDHLAEFEASNPKAALVAKRMLNYGATVQNYFAANLDEKFTKTMANEGIDLANTPITASTISAPADANVAPTNLSAIGISAFRNTAELKEGVDIQLGVRVSDAALFANAKVTCDDVDLPFAPTNASGTQQRATLENVVSNKLDNVYTFIFSNGETYKTSVLSYMKTLIAANPNNTNLVNLVSAAYWYNQAANDAFGD